jgi:hypothetical protein
VITVPHAEEITKTQSKETVASTFLRWRLRELFIGTYSNALYLASTFDGKLFLRGFARFLHTKCVVNKIFGPVRSR